jgi:hypothetical protein
LPPEEPDLTEPGDQVSATPALSGTGDHLRLDEAEGLGEELPARSLQLGEDRPFQARERRLLRDRDPQGYSRLGHGSVLSFLKMNGRYVPLSVRCGISRSGLAGRRR